MKGCLPIYINGIDITSSVPKKMEAFLHVLIIRLSHIIMSNNTTDGMERRGPRLLDLFGVV
jgi:hypothetical protein